jgi:hypothetical protein
MTKTVLSKDGEREYLDLLAKDQRNVHTLREFESDQHMRRQDSMTESRIMLDQKYRSHVLTCTLLNVLTTGAIVALCLVVIRYVL